MRKLLGLFCMLMLGAAVDSADARGFTISDFGAVETDPICVEKGRMLFDQFGADDIQTTDWTVNAYGIGGDQNVDAAVICAYGPDGKSQVSVVLHSWGDKAQDTRRREMAKTLRIIWDKL